MGINKLLLGAALIATLVAVPISKSIQGLQDSLDVQKLEKAQLELKIEKKETQAEKLEKKIEEIKSDTEKTYKEKDKEIEKLKQELLAKKERQRLIAVAHAQENTQVVQSTLGSLSARENAVRAFYLNQGYTPTAVAYLMGTIKQESNFDYTNTSGDGGLAHGLYQWHPDRRQGMPYTLHGQLNWSVQELNSGYPHVVNILKTSNNSGTVASAIKSWIRYGHTGNRYYYAQQYLAQM